MSFTPTQLTGGAFQDAEGNVLTNGYLILVLSTDENVAGVGNICAGVSIKIQLDSDGNVASSASSPPVSDQYVWANDVMTPVNSYYRVRGYSATGQPVFGPNNQQVSSGGAGGSTFDLGTWVPNSVISWIPSPQPLVLENSGNPNSSQTLFNLESSDSSVVITDEGGGTINIQTSSGGGGLTLAAFPGNSPGTDTKIYVGTAAIGGGGSVTVTFASSIGSDLYAAQVTYQGSSTRTHPTTYVWNGDTTLTVYGDAGAEISVMIYAVTRGS